MWQTRVKENKEARELEDNTDFSMAGKKKMGTKPWKDRHMRSQ